MPSVELHIDALIQQLREAVEKGPDHIDPIILTQAANILAMHLRQQDKLVELIIAWRNLGYGSAEHAANELALCLSMDNTTIGIE